MAEKRVKKVAVILCGSGFKDGSEIRESVLILLALSQHNIDFECFAPSAPQHDVINCLTGQPILNESRDMLIEAARIARGKVKPLTDMSVKNYDALIIPGGFGVAKNLCTFAFKGSAGVVRSDVGDILSRFFENKKPIGAICIAPALLALHFKNRKLTLTLGEKSEASIEIEKLGHIHEVTKPNEITIDSINKIVTTPAYMYDNASLKDINEGISALVSAIIKL